jgi:hypothetical protein
MSEGRQKQEVGKLDKLTISHCSMHGKHNKQGDIIID